MNYSRRQLYALGEPLGECVTRLKPGGRIYGGGDSPPADTTTTQTMELPEWARGYAKDTLAKGSALTDISKNPYQQYGGERIAGFQPLQQRTFETAEQMQPSQQVGLGSSIAGAAGLGALNTNYQGGRFYGGQFNDQAVQDYMDPYAKNVVDYQKAQALRDFQIAQPMRQAQAVQQGAFGGSRSAIIDAEAQRSLNSQLQGIEATGRQAAFQNAQQQFERDQARRLQAQGMGEQSRQYGAGLGMQGLQTGLQAAGQLGQLGQNEYGQRMGITQLQSQLGAQQQQQAQRPLDMAYQDFLNQQNYPYKQLGFMSDMIRGLPLGQQSTQSVYQAPPSTLQTLGALGMGAYGVNQMFGSPTPQAKAAEGGLAGSYADGGMVAFRDGGDTDIAHSPMDDPTEMAQAVSKLSDEQLQQIIENPSTQTELQAAKMELATRASESRGLASAYNMMPEQAPTTQAAPQAPMVQAARGGIMGFAGNNQSLVTDEMQEEILAALKADEEGGTGDADQRTIWNQRLGQAYKNITDYQPSAAMTDTERRAATKAYYQEVQDMAGTDPSKAQADRIAKLETQQAGELGQQKGLAALAAIPAILQGGNAIRGLGGGAGAFAGMYGKALQADRAEKRALMSMKNNLENAQYKTRVGMVGDARQLTAEARRDKQAAEAAHIAKNKALGEVAAKAVKLNAPVKAATRNFDIENKEDIAEDLKSTNPMKQGETPAQYKTRLNAMAARIILELKGTKDITSKSTVSSTQDISGTKAVVEEKKAETAEDRVDEGMRRDAAAQINKFKVSRDAAKRKIWTDLLEEHNGNTEAATEAYIQGYMGKNSAAPAAKPAAKPAAAPAQAGKVLTQADIAATAKASGKTIDQVKAQAKLKGYTIQ
jgi:hypothetical protein